MRIFFSFIVTLLVLFVPTLGLSQTIDLTGEYVSSIRAVDAEFTVDNELGVVSYHLEVLNNGLWVVLQIINADNEFTYELMENKLSTGMNVFRIKADRGWREPAFSNLLVVFVPAQEETENENENDE